jgi:cardiolipin synthase
VAFDRLFDVGAKDGPEVVGDRILTIPNLLSLVRLLVMPLVWIDITSDRPVRALIVLAVLVSTDWIDGYVARRFDQVSRLGKVLDPISDRILIAIVVVALGAAGIVPWWALGAVLLRDVIVGAVGLVVLARGGEAPAVTRTGKAATFGLMFTFPTFLLAEAAGPQLREVLRGASFVGLAVATVLYYAAAVQYARVVRARNVEVDG